MDPRQDHRSAVVAIDQVDVPQRLREVERRAHVLADESAQRLVASRRRERDVAHVVVDVELDVVLPVRHAGSGPRPNHALMKATEGREPLVEEGAQALRLDLAVEHEDARHHHQVGRVLHPEPGRVYARHRDQARHGLKVILRALTNSSHPANAAAGATALNWSVSLAPIEDQTLPAPPPRRAMTRRQVLAAAAATGIGVGVIRLLGGSMQQIAGQLHGSGTDWISPLQSESARVMQLLRRSTFGYTPAQLESAVSDGFNKTVDRLLETRPVEPAVPAFANTPGGRFPIVQLQQWWIDHMLSTSTPFAERMTLFWHGHFTSDYRKAANDTFMYWQNLTWRRMALTDLRSMLMQVTTDPAMLRYLDLATSTGQSPNENYSRELMELFTIGAGNYTENDVRESAKALAGWQLPQPDSYATVVVDKNNNVTRKLPVYSGQKSGVFNARRAYKGSVTYLGKTGALDTQGVIDRILAQPATAPFIAGKVAQHFVTARPSANYVKSLGDTFRRSKYDMKSLLRAVFTSAEFTSDQSYRGLVKSPTEFMVHTARVLGLTLGPKIVAGSGSGMGQSLFDPPDVNGWPNNEAWISSNTVVERVNFATAALAQAKGALPKASDALHSQVDGVLSPQTSTFSKQATDDRARWFILLASPEFQLK